MEKEQALTGMKVLDLTHHVAGPYCTKLLGDYGAEVVKIERPGPGDPARRMSAFYEDQPDPERNGLFLHLNTNKKSVTLNLKSVTGVKIFKQLVGWADIIVENFSPRVMPGLGLGYEVLAAINPEVIMTSISNFGHTGPYRDYRATDLVEYAMGGLMSIMGDSDRAPLKHYGFQAQYQAGLFGVVGTMTAWHCRHLTGQGQHVDVSIMESVMHMLEGVLTSYCYSGHVRKRMGNRRAGAHPFTVLPCKDGHVAVSALDRQWENVAAFTGLSQLIEDPRFQTTTARSEHADETDAALAPWLMAHGKEEIYTFAQEWRVPFGLVPRVNELIELRQLQAREFFVEMEHPITGQLTYPGAPFKMSESAWRLRRPAPLLGEDNEDVFCGLLGYALGDLIRLRQRGVI